jgi:hypothetical protein
LLFAKTDFNRQQAYFSSVPNVPFVPKIPIVPTLEFLGTLKTIETIGTKISKHVIKNDETEIIES